MNAEKLNHWLALVANFGVLAGIVFLIVEIQQNTDALQAESQRAVFAGVQQELYTSMQYPEIFRLMALPDADATFEQRLQIDSFLAAALRAREFAWNQHQAGILDDVSWETELEVIALLVGSERNRRWWRGVGHLQFVGEFRDLVSNLVENEPLHAYWVQVAEWGDP